ncbi:cytochrome-c peroxidase [Flavipsychrobacter stenotrophus]|nr:cytochrome c peroxidase [Flavipsychrobacter stenotrophus]
MKKVLALIMAFVAVIVCYSFIGNKRPKSPLSFTGKPANKVQLGEMLFFESQLSATRQLSCASCHIPEHGFADTVAFSKGINGRLGKRNAPSCTNLSGRPYLFYDGRAATIEEQVKFPIEDANEMGIPIGEVVKRLNKDREYASLFKAIFNEPPTEENLKAAIAAFERTLETSHTPFDRYMNDDSTAISASAIRGRELFMGTKAKCFDCHFSPDFTGDEFRNIGLYDGVQFTDEGRAAISKDKNDLGKFKVPGLRNVAVTRPYMHNGMFKTLREVIDHYDDPFKAVPHPINIDTLLQNPLHLTEMEKQDLENFLLTLTDDRFIKKVAN